MRWRHWRLHRCDIGEDEGIHWQKRGFRGWRLCCIGKVCLACCLSDAKFGGWASNCNLLACHSSKVYRTFDSFTNAVILNELKEIKSARNPNWWLQGYVYTRTECWTQGTFCNFRHLWDLQRLMTPSCLESSAHFAPKTQKPCNFQYVKDGFTYLIFLCSYPLIQFSIQQNPVIAFAGKMSSMQHCIYYNPSLYYPALYCFHIPNNVS